MEEKTPHNMYLDTKKELQNMRISKFLEDRSQNSELQKYLEERSYDSVSMGETSADEIAILDNESEDSSL